MSCIVGWRMFAQLQREIWHAAAADDPWADHWLLRIERALEATQRLIGDHHARLESELRMCGCSRVDPDGAATLLELQVTGPGYLHLAARLLRQYDEHVLALLQARNLLLISAQSLSDRLHHISNVARRALGSAQGYRCLKITCADVLNHTTLAKRAHHTLGPLPDAILWGRERARLAPRLPRSSPAHTTFRSHIRPRDVESGSARRCDIAHDGFDGTSPINEDAPATPCVPDKD